MQNSIKPVFFILIFLSFFACKKEAGKNNSVTSSVTSEITMHCSSRWQGDVSDPDAGRDHYEPDKDFINYGYAHIPINMYIPTYSTIITLDVPDCATVNGDSVIFEADIMNPADSGYSTGAGSDIGFRIYGETGTAKVNYSYFIFRAYLGVNSHQRLSQPTLSQVFNQYTPISVVSKNNVLYTYVNHRLEDSVDYTGDEIGNITQLQFIFAGSGYINNVNLYNSYTNEKLMHEGFNIDSTSTDIWY